MEFSVGVINRIMYPSPKAPRNISKPSKNSDLSPLQKSPRECDIIFFKKEKPMDSKEMAHKR